MLNHRRLPPRRRERRKKPSAIKQPHIRIGMWVRVAVWCGLPGCKVLPHVWQQSYFYHGPVVAKRGGKYLVECTVGMGSWWATRDQMYVRDLSGRYWNVPLDHRSGENVAA